MNIFEVVAMVDDWWFPGRGQGVMLCEFYKAIADKSDAKMKSIPLLQLKTIVKRTLEEPSVLRERWLEMLHE